MEGERAEVVGRELPGCDLETAGNRFSRGTRGSEVGIGSLDGNRNLVPEDAVGVSGVERRGHSPGINHF